MNRTERITALREASKVRRCHTILHHGDYTVGQHSYDALNLLLVLHPGPSKELMKAVAWHDCAERWSGDVPAPVKHTAPVLRAQLAEIEQRVERELEIEVDLTDDELDWLRAVDRIELWLWATEQVEMGNNCAKEIRDVLEDELWHHSEWMPVECRMFVQDYQWKVCSELTARWRRG